MRGRFDVHWLLWRWELTTDSVPLVNVDGSVDAVGVNEDWQCWITGGEGLRHAA